jgi:hypothetical protein
MELFDFVDLMTPSGNIFFNKPTNCGENTGSLPVFINELSRAKPAPTTEPPTAPLRQSPFPQNNFLAVN